MDENLDNTQKSEFIIARIIKYLMDNGIQTSYIGPEDIGLDVASVPFFMPCVRWLESEGVIRTRSLIEAVGGGGSVVDACLTSHGYALLGQRLALGDEGMRLGEAVSNISNRTGTFSQFGEFFGGLLGAFTKSIGS